MKTKKIVAKRFKITKTGLVMRTSQNSRHLRRRKSKSQLRKFAISKVVTNNKYSQMIKKFLPYN